MYWASYLSKTSRLTTAQHGAYLLLIAECWTNDSFPNDDDIICRVTGLTKSEWRKHKCAILPFFSLIDGAWRHIRVDEEIAEAAKRVQKSKERTAAATACKGNVTDKKWRS